MSATVLVLPGIGDSGPQHWQSLWQAAHPDFQRVVQDDWQHPVLPQWQARLERAIARVGSDAVVAAHSLGCLLLVHWAAGARRPIRGALLVAPPNPLRDAPPTPAIGFAPVPDRPLPFPSILVASTDDAYASFEWSQARAAAWGSRLVSLGAAGHVNAASGYGAWPEGLALLQSLRSGLAGHAAADPVS